MITGGCHCGGVRYEADTEPFDSDYCHCVDCRRSIGAPFGVWMDLKADNVVWLTRGLKEYSSSEKIRRGFCGNCGSSISYRSVDYPEYLTLSVASLDDPNQVVPTYHIYESQSVRWLAINDGLPRYSKSQGDA